MVKNELRFLTEAEYQSLLREYSHKPRDAAIIELFLQTGMRLSELAKLQLHDVEIPKRITPTTWAMCASGEIVFTLIVLFGLR